MSDPRRILLSRSADLDAFAGRRTALARASAWLATALTVVIVAIDHRFVIFGLVALGVAWLASIDAVATRRRATAHGFVEVVLAGGRITVRTAAAETTWAPGRLTERTDALFVVGATKPGEPLRRWEVPAAPGEVADFVAALRSAGLHVGREPRLDTVAAVFGGAFATVVLSTAGGLMAIAGVAGLLLAALGIGGSWSTGVVLVAGGFAILVAGRLVAIAVRGGPITGR